MPDDSAMQDGGKSPSLVQMFAPALSQSSLVSSYSSLPLHYNDDLSAFGSSIVFCWLEYLSGTLLAAGFH